MINARALRGLLVAGLLGMAGFASVATAAEPPVTAATLVDRAVIHDMLVDYYAKLGNNEDDFYRWYTADGRIDVNGLTGQGKDGIASVYKQIAAMGGTQGGTFRMVLSNVKISVDGDTATAHCIWTGLLSKEVTAKPEVVEQGREDDELVKQNGKWLFRNRIITSDGGLQHQLLKSYKKR